MAGPSRKSARARSRKRPHSRQSKPWLALVTSATLGAAALTPATAHAKEPRSVHVSGESLTRALAARRQALDWTAASAARQVQATPLLRFDISAGPLGMVLARFEEITGFGIKTENPAILELQSPGISGVMTAERALEQILVGTGVRSRLSAPRTVALDVAPVSESVDVTGRTQAALSSLKYSEPLRDVPQSVQVIPRAIIDEQGAGTLREVLRNVPGITMQAGEGGVPAGDNLSIRGFSARSDIFIDGVRDFGGYSRDSFNLEQVEVVKGPSSASAGRGSTGGSINLVTKGPMLDVRRDLTLAGGSEDFKRGTLDVNQPVDAIPGMAIRLNAVWQDSGVPGRDVVQNQTWGLAPSVAFGVGRPTQLTASYLHLDQDNTPDYGLPWVPATNVPLAAYADQPAPVRSQNFYGLRNRDFERINNDTATVMARHDTALFTLRNVLRFGRTQRDSLITAPRFASNDSTNVRRTDWKSRDQTDDILSNQSDLSARFSTGSMQHSVVSGVELSRERDTNFIRVETGTPAPDADLFNPNPNDPYAGFFVRDGAKNDGTARTAAIYGFDTVHLNERWDVSGGVRWDAFTIDYRAIAASGAETRFDRTDHLLSWRSGVVYKPLPEGTIYVGAGTSLNPSAEGLSLTASTADLAPERTRNYEVGTKWDLLDARAGLTFAVFHTDKTNARTPGINPGDPPTVLQGRQRVQGVEVGVTGRLAQWWNVLASYAGMRSRIVASNTATEVDKALANTPRHTFNAWTTVQLPRNIQVGGGAQFMDSVFTNAANIRAVPSYWLVNATAAWNVSRHLTMRLNGYNLGDRAYVDRVGGGHYIPGPRRSAMLTTDVGF